MVKRFKKFSVYPPVMMLSMYFAVFSYMVPVMMENFSMDYKGVGVISTVQFLGGLFAQVLCFSVFSALNKSKIVFISLVVVTLCLVWLGFNNVLFVLYILFFIRGFFGNTANTLSNALVTDVFDRRKEFFVGLYHALAAGAAIAGPYLALGLGSDFTISFAAMGGIIGVSAVVFWLGMRKEMKKPFVADKSRFGGIGKIFRLLRREGMVLMMLIIFFCSFAQNTIVLYITSFGLGIRGFEADGAFVLSMFLGGLFAGSMIYSFIAHRIPVMKIMFYFNILALGALAAMLVIGNALAVGILALAGGLFLGANMPGLFVKLSDIVPEDSGAVSALLFFGSVIAGLVAPITIGAIADVIGIRYALLISLSAFGAIIALVVVLRRQQAVA